MNPVPQNNGTRVRYLLQAIRVAGTALLLTALVGTATAPAADAAPRDVSPSTQQAMTQFREAQAKGLTWNGDAVDPALVEKFDKYISYQPSTGYTQNVPADVAAADPTGAAQVASMVALANSSIARLTGRIVVNSPNGTFVVVHTPQRAAAAGDTSTGQALAGSHGGFSTSWWGFEIWLDEWATGRLEAGLAAGSGAAWVAAELTSWTGIGGLSAGAIAAILAFGAGAIELCDWNDNGITVRYITIGNIVYCWPR